jgi:hypothetical protein
MEETKMKTDSIWKKMILLTASTVFAFHLQMANAQDNSADIKTIDEEAECVIKEDQ